jgi:hypothetical protein
MRYLRKTATYTVASASGETLLVDEFEAACPKEGTAREADRKLMLRDGEKLTRDEDGTLRRPRTGEQFRILEQQ